MKLLRPRAIFDPKVSGPVWALVGIGDAESLAGEVVRACIVALTLQAAAEFHFRMVLPCRAWSRKFVHMFRSLWGECCTIRKRIAQELIDATCQNDLDNDMNAWHLRWVFWKVWRRYAKTGKLATEV